MEDIASADLKFEKNTEYIDSDGGVVSAFKLYYKDGRIEYFDADGKVMKTQNRFGDAIYYRYYTNGDEINDDFTKLGQEYNKCVITDTCGRQVIVERKTKENYIQEITVKVLGSDGSEIEGTTQKYNIRSTMNTANMDTYAKYWIVTQIRRDYKQHLNIRKEIMKMKYIA